MQENVNSPDISLFSTVVTLDILNRTLTFDLSATEFLNSPAGSGCSAAFEVLDQNGVTLAAIDWTAPQITDLSVTTTYTLDLSYVNYNFLFTSYKITAGIRDTNNTVFYLYFPVKKICTPSGFNDFGYVDGIFIVNADCSNAVLTVKEATNFTYNNLSPYTTTTDGTLYYPLGTIGSIDFAQTPFSNNVVFTGTYKIDNTTTATYDLSDGFFVEVSYVTNNEFTFTCEKSMVDVLCCVVDIQKAYEANCDNARGARYFQQLQKVSIPLMVGFTKQQAGIDSSAEAAEVRKILNCDCGRGSIKHVQQDPVNPTVYDIVINGNGGTSVTTNVTGSTKSFIVSSNTYVVGKKDTGDLAFDISVDTSTANTVKYLIKFNYSVMANYILTAISSDSTLLTQLNSLVTATSNIDLRNLDGSCIIDMSDNNYFFTFRVPSINTIVTNIVINGATSNAPANLLVSDVSGIAAWLNGLALGTFSPSFTSDVTHQAYYFSISTNNNSNVVSTMTLTYNTAIIVPFQFTNKSLVAVLQAIINYLCSITGLKVYLGKVIGLCSFTYNDTIVTTAYPQDTKVSNFLTDMASVICDLTSRIDDAQAVTCAKIKSIFPSLPSGVFGSGDRFYGTLGGLCSGITREQAALAVISAIQGNSTVKAAYCAIDCSNPASCPDVGNISLAMSGSNIGVYGLTWTPANPNATQTVTVKYRVNGATAFITSTNSLQILPNGAISGTSPYQILGVSAGTTYDIQLINNCGGVGFIKQITTPTGTVYTGNYLIDTVIYNICGNSGVVLYSNVPFATGMILYTDIGLTTPLTGYDYVAPFTTAEIFEVDPSTGLVGVNTGGVCGGGTLGTYLLGNNSGTVCSASSTGLYTDGAFVIGGTLYSDSSLITPVTGYDFVVNTGNNHIYNLDNATGTIISDTGLSCSSNTVQITSTMAGITLTAVSGIAGFSATPPFPLTAGGGTIVGTHSAFTGAITCTLTGTPIINPSNIILTVNGVAVQCLTVTSAGNFTLSSRTYASSAVIKIQLNTGSCV